MKTVKALPIVAALAGAGLLALSAPTFAGIADTRHNLGTSNDNNPTGSLARTFSGTGEICVFCHTPHGADTSASVPLWNRSLPASNTYTTYETLATSSLDGTVTNVGSVSIACLSCHDGTQAMDVVLNAPGSGGFDSSGASMGTGAWTDESAGTTDRPQGIANLGQDLRNDHPVGIQYAGGGLNASVLTVSGNAKDQDFKDVASATVNGQTVWWVDVNNDGNRDKTDIQLYTRQIGTNPEEPFVECASCHDPHQSETQTFLRLNNTGSAVCLACHTK